MLETTSMTKSSLLLVGITLGIVVVTSCTYVRKVTYPPNFVYLEDRQVVSAMADLNVDMWRIDDIIANSETILPYQREEIIQLLQHMEDIADKLGAGTTVTNHLLIDENIDLFKDDVRNARKYVQGEPPTYYLAGRLSGSCMACHRRR
jgi:ABC-type enterochelin transport system permease subunit